MSKSTKDAPENLKWDGESFLKFLVKRHDPRFGDISIFENQRTKGRIMCKEKSSGDQKQFNADVHMAKQRLLLQNENLHRMVGWSTLTKKELCSTHHYVKMYFDYPASDLRNEVAERKKARVIISDSELSLATSNALHGLDYLHSQNLAHGDIRPQLISADRVGPSTSVNQFRLLDRLGDPSVVERAQVNNYMNNKELFMSPQLFKYINTKGKNRIKYSRQKNDLFALGMTIMSAGNGTSLKDCYNKGGHFNEARKRNHLEKFRERYTSNYALCNVVTNLLEPEEKNRPDTDILLGRKMKETENILPEEVQHLNDHQEVEHEELETEPMHEHENQEVEVNAHAYNPHHHDDQDDEFFKQQNHIVHHEPEHHEEPEEVVLEYAPASSHHEEVEVNAHHPREVQVNAHHPQEHEVKSVEPEISKVSGKVSYGEPRILRTYVDESSRRSYRGNENRDTMMVPASPRHKKNGQFEEGFKQGALKINPEIVASSIPVDNVHGKLIKRTVIIQDEHGEEIDRFEEPIHHEEPSHHQDN